MGNATIGIGIIGVFLLFFSMVFGIKIATKCSGKLKFAVSFLLISSLILLLHQIEILIAITGNAIGVGGFYFGMLKSEFADSVLHFMSIIFIFLSFFLMNRMINDIERRHNK